LGIRHRLVGLCYLNLKNYALAIVELGRAVQLKSPAFVTYQALAQAYFNTDRLDNCIQTLTQGEPLAKTPSDEYSLHHLREQRNTGCKIRPGRGRPEPSRRHPGHRMGRFLQLGVAYFNLDRYDEAIQALQKALTLKPGDAGTADVLGRAYFKQGLQPCRPSNTTRRWICCARREPRLPTTVMFSTTPGKPTCS